MYNCGIIFCFTLLVMKKPKSLKKPTSVKKSPEDTSEGKKTLKLKPIKSKEVKRSKNPSVFDDDEEDFFEDDLTGLDDFEAMEMDEDDF